MAPIGAPDAAGLDSRDAAAPISRVDPFAKNVAHDPHPTYDHLRELGPAVWLERYAVWAVAGYRMAEQVLADPKVFVPADEFSAPAATPLRSRGLPLPRPSLLRHAVLHSVLVEQFRDPALARWRRSLKVRALSMIRQAVKRGESDIAPVALRMAAQTATELVGLLPEGQSLLDAYAGTTATASNRTFSLEGESATERTTQTSELVGYLTGVVSRGRFVAGSAGANIVALCRTENIEDSVAGRLMASLVTASIDATTGGLTNLAWLLATHPAVWKRLQNGTVSPTDTVRESLRAEPPIRALCRMATTDAILGTAGQRSHIVSGERVLVLCGAANRDPARWRGPDRFDPSRPYLEHLAFGAGTRGCIGQVLATMELDAFLDALIACVDELTVATQGARRREHPMLGGFSQLTLSLKPSSNDAVTSDCEGVS